MTDANGRVVKTNLAYLLATTNAKSVKDEFKSEVLNRFDGVLTFNAIDQKMAKSIIRNYLEIGENLPSDPIKERFARQGIELEFDESVYDYMGYAYVSRDFGARYLTKQIEMGLVDNFLMPLLNAGSLLPGNKYRITHDLVRYVAINVSEEKQ
jgi:ATP-dependent Clp protease ATP-binding subunit ClpA